MYSLLVTIAGVIACVGRGVGAEELCLVGDFDSQLQHIVQTHMLTQNDIDNRIRVLDDLKPTLRKRWPDLAIFPFGSISTGLGLKTSDVDIYVQIPNCTSYEDMPYVLEETEKLFRLQPSLYSQISQMNHVQFSRVSFYHIPLQFMIDVVYRFGDTGFYNSKLIRYYFMLDKRFRAMGIFLKIWFKVNNLTGRLKLPSYAIYLLIIFYLQQKNMVPSVFELQKESPTHFIDKWNFDFNELPYNATNTENEYQLLGGFFKYYSEFNFQDYIVAPYVGRPLRRNAFVDIQKFPKEYTVYKKQFREELQLTIKTKFNITTDLCIQDSLQHFLNTGARVIHVDYINFKYLIKMAAKLFDELPSPAFIRAILTLNQRNDDVMDHKSDAGDDTNNHDNCLNMTLDDD